MLLIIFEFSPFPTPLIYLKQLGIIPRDDISHVRHPNNHSEAFKKQCLALATGIAESYGQSYERAVKYLKDCINIESYVVS